MKYKIIKIKNLPHPSWQIGDIVNLNDLAAAQLGDSVTPYEGEDQARHTFLKVDPLKIKFKVQNG